MKEKPLSKSLKIAELSSLNPYEIFEGNDGYYFVIEKGIKYSISFCDSSGYFPSLCFLKDKSFQIILKPETELKLDLKYISDAKISLTVSFFIHSFFEKNPDFILFYVCDDLDGREEARKRKFNTWFQIYNLDLEKHDIAVTKTIFASMLIKKSNPYYREITRAFKSFPDDLNNKF